MTPKHIERTIYMILENTDRQIMDLLQNLTVDQITELKEEFPSTLSMNQFDSVIDQKTS